MESGFEILYVDSVRWVDTSGRSEQILSIGTVKVQGNLVYLIIPEQTSVKYKYAIESHLNQKSSLQQRPIVDDSGV